MATATTRTFAVSEVCRGTTPLTEAPYKQAIESLLGSLSFVPEGDSSNDVVTDVRSEMVRPTLVESCARYHGRLLDRVGFHPFVAAVHRAFMGHRPLCISPDMVWLMICQGVANHVNAHAEALRPRLVDHQGKIEIAVRRDDLVKGAPENPWPEVFAEFSAQIRRHIGPAIDNFIPSFSTTGPVERAAAELVLLDAVQSFFDYGVCTYCGIPEIGLEGTTEDWQAIIDRIPEFSELGLAPWIAVLTPILEQFVRASTGDVDPRFWQSLYKIRDQSGGPRITGWITAFFPYLTDYDTGQANFAVDGFFGRGEDIASRRYAWEADQDEEHVGYLTIDSLPSGLAKVPFSWRYLDKRFAMEFLGGFVGVAQDAETLTLRPEIGWAVREAPTVN